MMSIIALSLLSMSIDAKLLGAAVIPHGDFALAPYLLPEGSEQRHAAERVNFAAKTIETWIEDIKPDLILLSVRCWLISSGQHIG